MSLVDAPVRLRLRDFVVAPAVCHVAVRDKRPGQAPPLHTHDFAEVFWIARGRAVHTLHGAPSRVEAGHLMLVAPGDAHGFAALDAAGYRIANVAFAHRRWRALLERYGVRPDPLARPAGQRQFRLQRAALAELLWAADEVLRGAVDGRALDRFLLNLLHLTTGLPPVDATAGAPPWLRRALAEARVPEQLARGTAALVALAGRSPEHVARACRRFYGKTPTALITELRLDEAAARLSASDVPVAEIAAALGHANLSHFYRLFRARFGVTPAGFRARAEAVTAGRSIQPA